MIIALIWASNNPEKYWNKILKYLVKKWHTVHPVNPKEEKIEKLHTHKILKTVPKNFDIANFVVPPNVTLQILKKYSNLLKNKKVWVQPWAEDEEVIDFLKNNWFTDYITSSCIMVEDISKIDYKENI